MLQARALEEDLNLQANQRLSVAAAWLCLASMMLAFWNPLALLALLTGMTLLVEINWPFYRYLYERRGLTFTACALPWHWLYFTYAGFGFGAGLVAYGLSVARGTPRLAPAASAHPSAQDTPDSQTHRNAA
jgi:hypothetical protein